MFRLPTALCVASLVAGCGSTAPVPETKPAEANAAGLVVLTNEQVAVAGITLVEPTAANTGATIEAPALLESDPQATRVVAATVSGRVVTLIEK